MSLKTNPVAEFESLIQAAHTDIRAKNLPLTNGTHYIGLQDGYVSTGMIPPSLLHSDNNRDLNDCLRRISAEIEYAPTSNASRDQIRKWRVISEVNEKDKTVYLKNRETLEYSGPEGIITYNPYLSPEAPWIIRPPVREISFPQGLPKNWHKLDFDGFKATSIFPPSHGSGSCLYQVFLERRQAEPPEILVSAIDALKRETGIQRNLFKKLLTRLGL